MVLKDSVSLFSVTIVTVFMDASVTIPFVLSSLGELLQPANNMQAANKTFFFFMFECIRVFDDYRIRFCWAGVDIAKQNEQTFTPRNIDMNFCDNTILWKSTDIAMMSLVNLCFFSFVIARVYRL